MLRTSEGPETWACKSALGIEHATCQINPVRTLGQFALQKQPPQGTAAGILGPLGPCYCISLFRDCCCEGDCPNLRHSMDHAKKLLFTVSGPM